MYQNTFILQRNELLQDWEECTPAYILLCDMFTLFLHGVRYTFIIHMQLHIILILSNTLLCGNVQNLITNPRKDYFFQKYDLDTIIISK